MSGDGEFFAVAREHGYARSATGSVVFFYPKHFLAYSRAVERKALEDAASLCERFAERDMHPQECADAIRAMISDVES